MENCREVPLLKYKKIRWICARWAMLVCYKSTIHPFTGWLENDLSVYNLLSDCCPALCYAAISRCYNSHKLKMFKRFHRRAYAFAIAYLV